jgi:tetratricopeptide (TPR) repeat protein
MNRAKQTFLAFAVIIFGFAAIYGLSNFNERARPALPDGYADEDLSVQGAKLKGFALGAEGLIADWYWMKSLQYMGDKIHHFEGDINLDNLKPLNPRLLYPYLDNAATLDPQFTSLYEYGANILPAIDTEKAILLTEKGIRENPDNWRLYHYLGYIRWKMHDYEKSAESYERGAAIKGAPNWMKMMSAKMKLDGGSRETSRAIYTQMFSEAQDAQTKESAALRLLQLQSLDERDAIASVLQKFKEKTNRCASDWSEIFPLLRTVKLPDNKNFAIDATNNLVDPSGAPYVLDKQKCAAALGVNSKIPRN